MHSCAVLVCTALSGQLWHRCRSRHWGSRALVRRQAWRQMQTLQRRTGRLRARWAASLTRPPRGSLERGCRARHPRSRPANPAVGAPSAPPRHRTRRLRLAVHAWADDMPMHAPLIMHHAGCQPLVFLERCFSCQAKDLRYIQTVSWMLQGRTPPGGAGD